MNSRIYLKLERKDIALLNKIIEAYPHLGVVSTLDQEAGLVMVRATPDTREALLEVISCLPFPTEMLPPPR